MLLLAGELGESGDDARAPSQPLMGHNHYLVITDQLLII